MASVIVVGSVEPFRALAVQTDGITPRSVADDLLARLSSDPLLRGVAVPVSPLFRASFGVAEELFVAVFSRAGLPIDDAPLLARALALVRSCPPGKRWPELFSSLERLLDEHPSSRSSPAAPQWESFLAQSRADAERLAATLLSSPSSPSPSSFASASVPPSSVAVSSLPPSSPSLSARPLSPRRPPSPRMSPTPSPRVSPTPSPALSPRLARPARPPPPSMAPSPRLHLAPSSPPLPSLPDSPWSSDPSPPPSSSHHSAVLIERVHHYSVGKAMASFFVVGSLSLCPAASTVFPVEFSLSLSNAHFADQILPNPSLHLVAVPQHPGLFSCRLSPPENGGSVELLRFLVHSHFPASRIPLRLVPLMLPGDKSMELTYEMNPVAESLDDLILEVLMEPGCSGQNVSLVNKLGEKLTCAVWDPHNGVLRISIGAVPRDRRRDKLVVSMNENFRCVSVSASFECRKLLCQIAPEFRDLSGGPVELAPGLTRLTSEAYYAK